MTKIYNINKIRTISKNLKKLDLKIVTMTGSFDLFHAGHLESIKQAKHQGDILIVGLNSDISVKKYKSKDRPIIPQDQRAAILEALIFVDYIVIMDQAEIAAPLVRAVRPHIHANSSEYGKNCIESETVKLVGAKLYLIPRTNNISTSNIIKKILHP